MKKKTKEQLISRGFWFWNPVGQQSSVSGHHQLPRISEFPPIVSRYFLLRFTFICKIHGTARGYIEGSNLGDLDNLTSSARSRQ